MFTDTISVMIPCYNSSATLPRALASLIAQSHQDWEALVIDDGSNDHPEKIVQTFGDSRIRYFRHTENKGRAQARESALQQMQGQYLTMLDADDWLCPEKLTLQLQVLKENPQVALVSTRMFLETSQEKLAGLTPLKDPAAVIIYPPLKKPRPLPIAHAPILVRASILKNRHYDIRLTHSEDLDFFLPILLQHSYAVLSKPLYVYAYEENRSLRRHLSQLRAHRKVFAKYLNRNPWTALWRILLTYPKSLGAKMIWLMTCFMGERTRGIIPCLSGEANDYLISKERVSEVLSTRFREPTGA